MHENDYWRLMPEEQSKALCCLAISEPSQPHCLRKGGVSG